LRDDKHWLITIFSGVDTCRSANPYKYSRWGYFDRKPGHYEVSDTKAERVYYLT